MLNVILLWRFWSVSSLDDSLDINIKDVWVTSSIGVNLLVLQVLGDIVQGDDGRLLLKYETTLQMISYVFTRAELSYIKPLLH